MNLVCLQHAAWEGPGALASWAKKAGHTLTVIRLDKGQPLPPVNSIDGAIILGGPMSVHDTDTLPWLRTERRFIESSIGSERVVIGFCLGAQQIAMVLGAQVRKAPLREIGWFPVQWRKTAATQLMRGLTPDATPVFHWHGEAFDIPLGASHLAASGPCPHQAFAYGKHVLAFQFHMEVTAAYVQSWIKHGGDDIKAGGRYVQSPEEMLKGVTHIPANVALLNTLLTRHTESAPAPVFAR